MRRAVGVVLVLLSLVTLYPFFYVLIQSFSDPAASGVWIVPKQFFALNYKLVFLTPGIGLAYLNTILRVALGVPLYLVVTGMAAYVFTRTELRGRRFILWLYIIPMYFSGGLIPFFILMRQIGLYNNFLVYILPACYGMWAMLVMKTAFKEVPDSLSESAMIDGAGYFRIFTTIIFPLSLPMFATMGLFQAVTYWNDWFYGTFLISDPNKWTLQTFLQLSILRGRVQIAFNGSPNHSLGVTNLLDFRWTADDFQKLLRLNSLSMETAYIMVSTIPIIILYPFVQRYFVKGVMIGSVKG